MNKKKYLYRSLWSAVLAVLCLACQTSPEPNAPVATYHKWHRVELVLNGPETEVTAAPNPFLLEVNVIFTAPDASSYAVPAFYDGDGQGCGKGHVWKVRFSPNATGAWKYESASAEPVLAGFRGAFNVDEPPADSADFLKWGRLIYAGGHYLKFTDGGYWIKGGCDDPENFLGASFLFSDFNEPDTWASKKKAADYLSGRKVNSIYCITNTIHGDRPDSWPWIGNGTDSNNRDRFDVGKLLIWEDFFAYCQNMGLVLHIVLNDDSGWTGYDSRLYFREMVARFGHHPAIIWNIGEEANETFSNAEQEGLAQQMKSIDPFGHPVTVHRKPDANLHWPFLGNPLFDLTSIQAGEGIKAFSTAFLPDIGKIVRENRIASFLARRPIPVMIDETSGVDLVDAATILKMRTKVLYPIYLSGGNFELHFKDSYGAVFNSGGEVTITALGPMWDDMFRARQFLEQVPFAEMEASPQLISSADRNLCLAKPGSVYAIYLSAGGNASINLTDIGGEYQVQWYNPRTGERADGGRVTGGGWRSLGSPAFAGDVAATVKKL